MGYETGVQGRSSRKGSSVGGEEVQGAGRRAQGIWGKPGVNSLMRARWARELSSQEQGESKGKERRWEDEV